MIEELLQQLENLASALDDGDHGKTPHASHVADLIEEVVAPYREAMEE